MSYSELLRTLHTSAAPASKRKWILRLPDRREFRKCYAQWKALRQTFPGLRQLRPLALINGFSFAGPHNAARLRGIHRRLRIERDGSVRLDAWAVHAPNDDAAPLLPWGVQDIEAPKLWKFGAGAGIRIGVIDTGVDFAHPDLQASVRHGINLIRPGHLPVDDNGHGTHIAGTIAAFSEANGLVGVAPGAAIHPIKAFDRNGTAYVSDIIAGIEWCVRQGIPIINMSFGMNDNSVSLQEAVRNAYKQGTIIVASAGNDGRAGTVDYPAGYAETICVGAATRKRAIASFSNRRGDVDLYAPGADIYSCWRGGGYEVLSGTSMATAHVSGALALLMSASRNQTLGRLKRALIQTAEPLQSKTGRRTAPGIVNVWKAYRRLQTIGKRKNRAKSTRRPTSVPAR